MKRATVSDLRKNFSKIESWLGDGEEVRIERRGKPVALLTALHTKQPTNPVLPDFAARRKAIWGERVFTDEEVCAMKD